MKTGDLPSRTDTRTDLVLGLLLAAVFVAAGWQTLEWDVKTALFPRIVTATGAALSLLFLVMVVGRLAGGWRGVAQDADANASRTDGEDDEAVEYVFATVGRAAWTQALAWIAAHLLLLLVAGLFVTSSVFTFAYLRWAGGRSWFFSAAYAVVLTAVLYVALRILLVIPVPEGLLFGSS
ncbi:tripartite tricarboxylate transporter TctB family protein [Pseudonocardia sichuanensis]